MSREQYTIYSSFSFTLNFQFQLTWSQSVWRERGRHSCLTFCLWEVLSCRQIQSIHFMKNAPFTHDLICECRHAVLQSTMTNVEKMHKFKKCEILKSNMRCFSNTEFGAWLRKIDVSEATFMVDLLQTSRPRDGGGTFIWNVSLWEVLHAALTLCSTFSVLKCLDWKTSEKFGEASFLLKPGHDRWVLIVAGFPVKLTWNLLHLNFTEKLKNFKKQLFRRFFFF